MERRDQERAARADIARLEEGCRELKRRLRAASASAEYSPAPQISDAPPQLICFPFRIANPAERGGLSKTALPATAQVAMDSDLPGSRYGP